MGKTLKDAGIATNRELDEIANDYGLFATAEATTMEQWVKATQATLLQEIQKTRREMGRLDASLARFERLVHTRFGQTGSTSSFTAEYAALEGWSLTLMANYIALVHHGEKRVAEERYERAIRYLRGAVQLARNHPRTAAQLQKPVIESLTDQSVIFS